MNLLKSKLNVVYLSVRCNQVWGSFKFGNEQIVGKEAG